LILVERADSVFSNEAVEEESFWREVLVRARGAQLREGDAYPPWPERHHGCGVGGGDSWDEINERGAKSVGWSGNTWALKKKRESERKERFLGQGLAERSRGETAWEVGVGDSHEHAITGKY
jgi:hypothetical protein